MHGLNADAAAEEKRSDCKNEVLPQDIEQRLTLIATKKREVSYQQSYLDAGRITQKEYAAARANILALPPGKHFSPFCFFFTFLTQVILATIPELLDLHFDYPPTATLRGKVPSEPVVPDIGQYFPILNRRAQLLQLLDAINTRNETPPSDSSKQVRFTICNGIAGIGKTTFVTHGIPHLLDSLKKMAGK